MKISVIMGIYNCEEYLEEAIQCILDQTYTDWELIMCDDGSSDQTYSIAEKYEKLYPNKIRLLKNIENKGLNYTLNRCLQVATGDYIARMDGDDRCSADRFEKEVAVLDNRNDISCGSKSRQECSISPAASMVRKEAFEKVDGYTVDQRLLRVEDYHLWMKMYAEGYKGYNIQEPLYQMRDDKNAFSRRTFKYRINETYVKILIIKNFGLPVYR